MIYAFPSDPDDPGIEMHAVPMTPDEYWALLSKMDPEQRSVQLHRLMGVIGDLEQEVANLHKFIGVLVFMLGGRVEVPFDVQEMGTILLSYESDEEQRQTVLSIVPDPDSERA